MATVLDLGLLAYFVPVFVFFLVLVIVWALLEKTHFFQGNKFVNLLIAFVLAVLFVIVPELSQVVALATPWFGILFLFLLLLILTFLFMGVNPEDVSNVFSGGNMTITWAIIIISLAIFGYAFTQVYGDAIHDITAGESEEGSADLVQNVGQILFTPKILGMVLLLGIAAFTVRFLSQSVPGPKGL